MGKGEKMKKSYKIFWNIVGGIGILTAVVGIILLLLKLIGVL
jgi:hypothetical protein